MNKLKLSHKIIVLLLLLFCLLPQTNKLYAQGPNAPEASSFEPLDATDMVNLVTGDLTYILPLLNVPSPEGGYPISLAYHAGIAMDQEASWVGLGWTLNPGAINRGVNGFPDDWKNAIIKERFYDETQSQSFSSVTTSYTAPSGTSVGLSISYEGNKGFGGSVSFTQGIPYINDATKLVMGSVGIGGTIGINPGGKFIGSVNGGYTDVWTNNSISISLGTNGLGLNVQSSGIGIGGNYSFTGEASVGLKYKSIGMSFSSSGISMSIGVLGIGHNNNFNNNPDSGDYNTYSNDYNFDLVVPTPWGTFGLGYRRQYIKWALNKTEVDKMNGPIYFDNVSLNTDGYTCDCGLEGIEYTGPCPCLDGDVEFGRSHNGFSTDFMDVYETYFEGELNLNNNNFVAPAYDNYNISAQGLSGSMSPTRFENGALIGLSKEVNADGDSYNINYNLNVHNVSKDEILSFSDDVYFNFKNDKTSISIFLIL
ncbi:MAG: hypothetical protein L3J69_09125 [Desulfobacula sp.]|nr:hypothetical protein [Desulfobacula sp.]